MEQLDSHFTPVYLDVADGLALEAKEVVNVLGVELREKFRKSKKNERFQCRQSANLIDHNIDVLVVLGMVGLLEVLL